MHFFTDHNQLTVQSSPDGYGPDPGDPTRIYNVTSRFVLTAAAKVFACEAGMLVVQQSVVDASLVNLILKPNANARAVADVSYYVYRGVRKDSLIAAGCVLQATGTNELLTRIWNGMPADTSCGTLGYDLLTIPDTDDIESIFDNSRATAMPAITPIFVKEGEWIGTFGSTFKIGFEVLLNTQRFPVTLGYVRADRHFVNVTGLAGMDLRIRREEILGFADPAAFFGLHLDQRVSYSEYGTAGKTTRKTTKTPGSTFIYTKLLQRFATRNRVYLDIRSEKGYSYNFYGNYGDPMSGHNLDVAVQSAAGVPQVYGTHDWPIFYTEAAQPTSEDTNNLKLMLRIDDNAVPILYIGNVFFKDRRKRTTRYFKEKEIAGSGATATTTWSKRLQVNFANVGTGSSPRLSVATYIKLNYFRQQHNGMAPPGVLLNEKYFDSAFCSIDLPRLGDATATKKFAHSAEPIFVREPNNADGTGNFALNMANGAYWDTGRVLFYCTFQYEDSEKTSEKVYLNTYNQKLNLAANPDYTASRAFTATEILCRAYTVGAATINIPSINLFRGEDLGATRNHKENAMFLGLTVAQVASLRADTQLDRLHHRFIHLEADGTNPQTTATGNHRYFRYTVRLQGMSGNADPARVTPMHAGNPIVVYSRDNQFFSSAEFAATEMVTAGQNRIEFHIFHDGCIKITDNKDLALVHDLERIWYFYTANGGMPVEACNLDVVMANKMRRVSRTTTSIPFPTIPMDFNLTIDYAAMGVPGVSASASYENADGDIFTSGTDGNRKYVNQKKKVFLVHFVEADVTAEMALAIEFTYVNTLRRYARPELAAAIIGALVQINHPIICQGFAYADASCYPSAQHVNGEAMDTNYNLTLANDVAFIEALNLFGFRSHLVGDTAYLTGLHNHSAADGTEINAPLHNGHLHSTRVTIRDCQRNL